VLTPVSQRDLVKDALGLEQQMSVLMPHIKKEAEREKLMQRKKNPKRGM
jgi:hypothetical protein